MLKLTCPQCGKRMTLDIANSRIHCPACGFVRGNEIEEEMAAPQPARPPASQSPGGTPIPRMDYSYIGKISAGAEAAYESGYAFLQREEHAKALERFLHVTELEPEFADAHLWVARLTSDDKVRAHHLDSVLARDPTNAEAIRLKMIQMGRLTPEQAARTYDPGVPKVRTASEPVQAKTEALLCPVCNGELTVNQAREQVECRFCGYAAPHEIYGTNADLLTAAMLERRARLVRWNVGARAVVCRQCGAEHTLPANKLASRCRFCGSTQVILSDVLRSFEQPSAIIPFQIEKTEAEAAIQRQLKSIGQRLANLFNANRVKSIQIEGAYIPYWMFDVTVDVTIHRTEYIGVKMVATTEKLTDGLYDVFIPAVNAPPRPQMMRLAPFNSSEAIPYNPQWLATYPAELYTVDVDKASMDARQYAAETMRRKHQREARASDTENSFGQGGFGQGFGQDKQKVVVTVSARVLNMMFQLLLLPVWIATLVEVDGDIRAAYVNGQTGEVVFGDTQRRK